MNKDDILRIAVKYGIVLRVLNKAKKRSDRRRVKVIRQDLKHGGEELLDYLGVCKPKTIEEFIGNINIWLDLEAKMSGFPPVKYTVGEGENIFKKIVLERALYVQSKEPKDKSYKF